MENKSSEEKENKNQKGEMKKNTCVNGIEEEFNNVCKRRKCAGVKKKRVM